MFKAGVWHYIGKFLDMASERQKRHNSVLYAIIDQGFNMFNKPLGFFARVSKMIESDKNQVTGAI